nr:methyl-accepting chemotaxis protein [Desulfobacteraceae bacterium]
MKKMTLKSKLIIGGVIAAILPLIVVGFFAISKSSSALISVSQGQAKLTAQNLAAMTNMFIQQEIKLAEGIAVDPLVMNAVSAVAENGIESSDNELRALDDLLSSIYGKIGNGYNVLFVTDSKGAFISDSEGGVNREKGLSVAERDYFQSVKTAEHAVIGSPVISKTSGMPIVVIAVPLKTKSGLFIGMFGVSIKLEELSSQITQVKVGETGYPFMVAKDGLFIAHPVKEYIFELNMTKLQGMEEISRRALARETGVEKYRFKEVDKISGFASVDSTGWSLVVTQNESEFMAPVVSIQNIVLLAGGIFLVLTVLAVLWFVKGIMSLLGHDPSEIAKVADQIAAGDLTFEFKSNGRPITGVYANMKQMTENLKKMFKDISGGVQTLTSSSTELSAVSQQMASGAERSE